MSDDRVTIQSYMPVPSGDRLEGEVAPEEVMSVTVYLREPPGKEGLGWIDRELERPIGDRSYPSREQYAQRHGADPADVDKLVSFAQAAGLGADQVDHQRRSVRLRGAANSLGACFGTRIARYTNTDGRSYRAPTSDLSLPADIAEVVSAVFGLDERPLAEPRLRVSAAPALAYTPLEVGAAYTFPPPPVGQLAGAGQTIGIVELGGGYRQADLDAYFAALGLNTPTVSSISVDGGTNSPGSPAGPDTEVMLDLEVAGALAPGARLAVYFAPNTNQGFIDAVSTAVHDTTYRPSVISISWGAPEGTWGSAALVQMERVFTEAAALGVTVTVASGDGGSSDGETNGLAHVDFPAAAPHALGCGGTRLLLPTKSTSHGGQTDATATGDHPAETVWNDLSTGGGASGGGISDVFSLPSYQIPAHVPVSANPGGAIGRGVPDVAGDADPDTGYRVRVDGQELVVGGTSAVAPLWAALIARLNQALGVPVGFVNPDLYSAGAAELARRGPKVFYDITSGNNGAYRAGPGWDPCTGWGSPESTTLLAALRSAGA